MIEIKKVNTIFDDLKNYDYLAKDDDYIQMTEWVNGEGYTVDINGKMINLTSSEIDAINYLRQQLEYKSRNEDNKN